MLRNRNELDKKFSLSAPGTMYIYVKAKGINVHPIYLDICQYGAKYLCFSKNKSCSKGGFFSESEVRFSNLQKTILNLKFEFPANNTIL